MQARPAVIVNGLADAIATLHASRGTPFILLSPPGAALFAGCLWWQEVVRQACEEVPGSDVTDVLDCADASGLALSAIRIGLRAIVLHAHAPGHAAVVAIAAERGILLLTTAPPALNMAQRGAARRLEAWLHPGDTGKTVG